MHIRGDSTVCVHLGDALSYCEVQPFCSSAVYHVQSPSRLRMSALCKSQTSRDQSMSIPIPSTNQSHSLSYKAGLIEKHCSSGFCRLNHQEGQSLKFTMYNRNRWQKIESSPSFAPFRNNAERSCGRISPQPPAHLVPTHTLRQQ